MARSIRRIALTVVLATTGAGAVGCGSNDDRPVPPARAYDVSFLEGWKPASAHRLRRLRESYETGLDELSVDAQGVKVHELWISRVRGRPAEIDIQTEPVPEGMDVALYDEISRETLSKAPAIVLEGTRPYTELDGEETVVFENQVPGVSASRIVTAIHDGYAYNVSLETPDEVTRHRADDALRAVIESWDWADD